MIQILYAYDMHGFPHRLMVLDAATVMTADKGCYMQKVELTDFVYLGQPNDTVTPESLALMLAFTYFEGRSPTLSKEVARIIRDSGLRVDSGLLPLEVNIRKGEDTELPWTLTIRNPKNGEGFFHEPNFEDANYAKLVASGFLQALVDMGCNIDFKYIIEKGK